MHSYRIQSSDKLLTVNKKKYRIKQLTEIKENLAVIKSALDKEYKDPKFEKYWRDCDPFKNERKLVANIGNTINVSNAWLKCYEILNYYKLLNDHDNRDDNINDKTLNELSGKLLLDDNKPTFIHFDNAAFPGAFIISTHHLIKTQYYKLPKFTNYTWYGSSLLSPNEQATEPLEDKYHLYKNYPDNWLMNKNNNGDVLDMKNQLDFCKRLGGKIDLYTSDLGFDFSSDYNKQEILHLPANIGQILSGLLTLKKGGMFFTKQYSIFESTTLSLMYATASFFEEFYICKPYTSREANSETYLVGKNFKGGVYLKHPYIQAMFDRLSRKDLLDVPLFDHKDYPKSYLVDMINMCRDIYGRQGEKIKNDIQRTYDAIKLHDKYPTQNPIILDYLESVETDIQKWYDANKILPIIEEKKLDMKNMYDV